jgi:hypothetical protein
MLLFAGFEARAQRTMPPEYFLVPPGLLALDDRQRSELRRLQRELHGRRCDLDGRILEAQSDLRQLYDVPRRNLEAIGAAFRHIAAFQQQRLEARIEAENRVEALLNDAQRAKLLRWRRGQARAAYPEFLPYMMYPGPQTGDFGPWNIEEPEQRPVPSAGGAH